MRPACRSTGPLVEVCAVAKRDLRAGEVLDNYGHFMTYGEAATVAERRRRPLPADGSGRGMPAGPGRAAGRVVGYDDVEVPPDRVADRLYLEQEQHFADPAAEPGRPA